MIKIYNIILLLLFISSIIITESRYISYDEPNSYKTGDKIPTYMNNIRAGLVIYDYNKYPFPKAESIEYFQTFQSRLAGDLKSTSPYTEIAADVDSRNCNLLSSPVTYTKDDINTLKYLIDNHFRINFFIDDLPVGEFFKNNKIQLGGSSNTVKVDKSSEAAPKTEGSESDEVNTEKEHILLGYPIGFTINERYYLYNHLDITINTTDFENTEKTPQQVYFYIQSVNVSPSSWSTCASEKKEPVELKEGLPNCQYTYSIKHNIVHGKIEQRWLIYYVNQIELSSAAIVNSIIITVATSICLAVILLKIFRKTNYNQLAPEDSGWKSIYADVFRSPHNYMTFSIIVGNGVQIASALFILMVFSVAGLTSIATPGGMAIAAILIFSFTGIFNGYASMRTYIMLGGSRKLYNSVITATMIPFTILVLIFIGFFQVWKHGYTYSPSAGSFFFVLAMWIFVCVPCSLLSSYFVRQWPPSEYPVRTNPIPRYIPLAKWYQNPYLHMMLGGMLPFAIIFIELSFFLSSWILGEHYVYSSSLAVTFILMIISIIETNMILEYYQLSLENYNWWWRSLIGPTSTGLYTFIYFIYFGIARISPSNGVWFYYFMFSITFSVLVSLFCSSIGFLGNLWFTKKIYSTLHFD